jgi:hypothetical protein
MVYLADSSEFLVGTSKPGVGVGQELYSFETVQCWRPELLEKWMSIIYEGQYAHLELYQEKQSPTHPGQLMRTTLVGKEIVCIISPRGVQPFSAESYNWTNNPPLLVRLHPWLCR